MNSENWRKKKLLQMMPITYTKMADINYKVKYILETSTTTVSIELYSIKLPEE